MSIIQTSNLHEIPDATNSANSAVVTFSADLNLTLEGVAAGNLFKYKGENVIYTVKSVDTAIQITLNETVGPAHTNQPFIIVRDVTSTHGLYLPRKGDPDWAALLRRNYMIIDRELGNLGGNTQTLLNIQSATDDQTVTGSVQNPTTTPFKYLPKQGGGAMYATITTGANIDSTAYLKMGVNAQLQFQESGIGASARLVFIYAYSTTATPVDGDWTTFAMQGWPGTQGGANPDNDAGENGDTYQLSSNLVLPITPAPSTQYNVTVRFIRDSSSGLNLDCLDSTNSTTRKIWLSLHNNG